MQEPVVSGIDRSNPRPLARAMAHVVELTEEVPEFDNPEQQEDQEGCDKGKFDEACPAFGSPAIGALRFIPKKILPHVHVIAPDADRGTAGEPTDEADRERTGSMNPWHLAQITLR